MAFELRDRKPFAGFIHVCMSYLERDAIVEALRAANRFVSVRDVEILAKQLEAMKGE